MIYSKFLKHSRVFLKHNLKSPKFSHILGRSFISKNNISFGSCIYLNNCQYSTIFASNFSDSSKPVLKPALPLKLYASLSTDGSSENYQIILTNPTEGTSTTLNSSLSSVTEIKDVPEVSSPLSELTDIATSLSENLPTDIVEPSLASLGLCNWTPVGLIQMLLEQMHIGMHWPWWFCIAMTTVIARTLLFPVLLKTQKSTINMSNHMPQLQYLQLKFGEARRTGNSMEASKLANEMMHFMKDKNINPIKTSILPLIQAPVFLSFFFALRSMASTPVESMKNGGLWWVTDLTIPDPYYVLPIIACSTLYVILKVGAESGVRMENLKMAKYFLKALPIVLFPFCINFPAAVLYYWCTNNFVTLGVVSVLKIQSVRTYFNLPNQLPIDPKFIQPKKGFMQGVKDAIEDQKALSSIDERKRIDNIRFQKAGTGPIPRTYSYDPTKPRPSNVAASVSKSMAAKQREDH